MPHFLASGETTHAMLTTMVTAISAGVMLLAVARHMGIPAIVVLLFGGIALGPVGLGLVQPKSMGEGLSVLVAIAVGLILFEGGLTLDVDGYRDASKSIRRLLTVGVAITWFATAGVLRLLCVDEFKYAVAAASLVIVTGPTVIAPLLKRIKIKSKLHNMLHWEGVLIDPIGVFVAVLCFEWLGEFSGQTALTNLAIRVAAGLAIGAGGGFIITIVIKRGWVPEEMINVFALAAAVLVFGVTEAVRSEAGLLSVTVAGFVFGLTKSLRVKQVRQFKAELTDMLIGTLFILLAARLTFDQFASFGWRGALAVAAVMLVVRPLNIFASTMGLGFTLKERAFLSWIAPRGIVAASMASLFSIKLASDPNVADPRFVETFTYSVIMATIVIQGLTAAPLSRWLGLRKPDPTGWLVVGAHLFARRIAEFISNVAQLKVVLVDNNGRLVREAQLDGLTVLNADARDVSLQERPEFEGVGNVLALTDNEDLNIRVCQSWQPIFGGAHLFRCTPRQLTPGAEPSRDGDEAAGHAVWPTLPKPTLVAGELTRGESKFILVRDGFAEMGRSSKLLARVGNNRLLIDGDSDDPATFGEGITAAVFLQRREDYLYQALRPELIVDIEVESLRSLFETLMDRVVSLYPDIPRDKTIEELIQRESAFPTSLGHGVAVPHCYVDKLNSRLCAVARIRNGMNFAASDREPVRLVFLLLSPNGDPERHLATLADIARLVIDESVRHELLEAGSPLDVITVIRKARQER